MKEFTNKFLIPLVLIALMITSIADKLAIINLTNSIGSLVEIETLQGKRISHLREDVAIMSKYQDEMTYLYYGVAKIAIETKLKNDVLYSTMNKIVDILKEIASAGDKTE